MATVAALQSFFLQRLSVSRLRRKQKTNSRQIRRNADIELILIKLKIEFKRKGNNLYTRCFNPEHEDKGPSWHMYAVVGADKNGIYRCWSCKVSGDIYKLVMQLKKCDFQTAVKFVSKYSKTGWSPSKVEDKDYYRDTQPYEPQEIGYEWDGKKFKPHNIDFGSPCSEYLISRWIGSQYIDLFGLLDWREKKRVVAPITRDGRLISWVARSYNGRNPKTLAPLAAPKNWELFGYDQLDRSIREVNLVEGWADVIRLAQINRPNPLGLCGSLLSEFQVESILWADKITAWLEGDIAGRLLGENTACWLTRNLWIVKMPEKTDPSYFSPDVLRNFKPQNWRTNDAR